MLSSSSTTSTLASGTALILPVQRARLGNLWEFAGEVPEPRWGAILLGYLRTHAGKAPEAPRPGGGGDRRRGRVRRRLLHAVRHRLAVEADAADEGLDGRRPHRRPGRDVDRGRRVGGRLPGAGEAGPAPGPERRRRPDRGDHRPG